ncbi:MAG: sigma-70 family RNA polymerase sigma factor [Acidimicrobiales bacterium]
MTDDAAFEAWYRALYPNLVASIGVVFGDPDLARDAADEAVARAYERWHRVREMSSPNGWAYQVALNEARRRRRRQAIERRLLSRGAADVRALDGPTGELWQLVRALPVRQRTAVVLRHVADLTEPEIGEAMGISRGGVSSTLRAAHASLRRQLADVDDPRWRKRATT